MTDPLSRLYCNNCGTKAKVRKADDGRYYGVCDCFKDRIDAEYAFVPPRVGRLSNTTYQYSDNR